jgi:hypothetical protein
MATSNVKDAIHLPRRRGYFDQFNESSQSDIYIYIKPSYLFKLFLFLTEIRFLSSEMRIKL